MGLPEPKTRPAKSINILPDQPGRKRIYVYPNSAYHYQQGSNTYIPSLIHCLGESHHVVNAPTHRGMLDVLLKLHKCDVVYFNWVEDLPEKKHGYLQILLLVLVLCCARLFRIKILWFVHNNLSHEKTDLMAKKFVTWLMRKTCHLAVSHSSIYHAGVPAERKFFFPHPVGAVDCRPSQTPTIDILIWGTITPYKGILGFVQFVSQSASLAKYKITIAGKFVSKDYYSSTLASKTNNITIIPRMLDEEELETLIASSKYILFTYNSDSVLSSAALCKSLSYGVQVIGPDRGAFSELHEQGLIHVYSGFPDLENLLRSLDSGTTPHIDVAKIDSYASRTSWTDFGAYLSQILR